MLLRFGYVAMSVELVKCSPSGTVTFKTYSDLRLRDPEAAISKLRRTARENINNTLRLLRHNAANGVLLYRFSSRMVPLATHPGLAQWDYLEDIKDLLAAIGDLVREKGMRVSFHPDHFTLINTPREEVFLASMRDFEHHCSLLDAMGLDDRARLVTHVGGGYRDKDKSLGQFMENWGRVPPNVARRITLENDDRTFTAEDVLHIGEKMDIPVVLDLHHYRCNHEEGSRLEEVFGRVAQTWRGTGLNPKVHASSPRGEKDLRSHHDYVDPADVYPFIMAARGLGRDIDIMVEAKKKDAAMFKLVSGLAVLPGLKPAGRAALELV